MGASQSIEGATAAQLARVGPFKLRSSEKLAVDALSEILTNLLRKNNLFTLSKILNYPDGCKDLIILISSTINKEFQLLKFPEPKSRSSMISMSFIDKDMYESPAIEGDFTRRKACSEIARFLIRLVTLCAAATASISLNTNLGGAITEVPFETTAGEVTLKKDIKNLPDFQFKLGPISPTVIALLKSWGFASVDKARPYLLFFVGNNMPSNLTRSGTGFAPFGGLPLDSVIDTRNSVVYMPKGEKSPVLGIRFEMPNEELIRTFERVRNSQSTGSQNTRSSPQYTAEGPQFGFRREPVYQTPQVTPNPVPVQDPFARIGVPQAPISTNLSKTRPFDRMPFSLIDGTPETNRSFFGQEMRGQGRTRKMRLNRRRTFKRRLSKQSGGAVLFLKVTLSEFQYETIKCVDSFNCKTIEFTLDSQGNTILIRDLENFGRGSSIVISPISFTTRISEQFGKMPESSKIDLVTPSTESADDRGKYMSIFEPTPKTYETFQRIASDISGSTTGTGPAPYRAFLLASELDPSKTKLTTMFCLDKWAGKWLTESLGYSLLQSLYNDGLDGNPTSPAAEELQILAKNFIGDKLATEDTKPGEYAKHLGNLKFYPIPSALKDSYCKRSGTAPPFTNIPADKDILTTAHQDLRKLYDTHIAAVVDIMRNVLTIRRSRTDASDFRFRLSEKYFKDSRGALVVLEEDIQKMRHLIAKHYFDVEKTYRTALEQLSYTRRGFTPNTVVDTLGRADAALEKDGV